MDKLYKMPSGRLIYVSQPITEADIAAQVGLSANSNDVITSQQALATQSNIEQAHNHGKDSEHG